MENMQTIDPVVVLVDDDEAVAHALKFSLEMDGFTVQTYASAEALLTAGPFPERGCLVLDAHLPGIDGLELLARIRARNVTLPAVLVTTAPNAALRTRAAAAGTPIIEKPLMGDVLLDALRRAVGATAD